MIDVKDFNDILFAIKGGKMKKEKERFSYNHKLLKHIEKNFSIKTETDFMAEAIKEFDVQYWEYKIHMRHISKKYDKMYQIR